MKPLEAFYKLTVLDPDGSTVHRLLSEKVDWEAAASIGLRLSCPLVFYSNLKKYRLENLLTPSTRDLLRSQASAVLRSGLYWQSCLYELGLVLGKEGVRWVPLKGISLLTDTYRSEELRAAADLDLMVPVGDFEKCLQIFSRRGWRVDRPVRRGLDLNQGQECTVFKDDKTRIDLHCRFFPWYEEKCVYRIDSAVFFRDAVPKQWKGIELFYLRKEDEFYYLLLCAFREGFRLFRYCLDADSLVRVHGGSWDWDRIAGHLRQSPLQRPLGAALDFLTGRLQTPIPEELTRDLGFARRILPGFERDFFRPALDQRGRTWFCFLRAGKWTHRLALAVLYLKWQAFKAFGCFRGSFAAGL